jgi:hypothetical protein
VKSRFARILCPSTHHEPNDPPEVCSGPLAVAKRTSHRLVEFVTATVPANTPRFAAFRATGDEASLTLGSGQLIAGLTTRPFAFFTLDQRPFFKKNPFRNFPTPHAFWWLISLALILFFVGLGMTNENWPIGAFILFLGEASLTLSILALFWMKTTLFDNLLLGVLFSLLCLSAFIEMYLVGTLPPKETGGRLARWGIGFGYFMAVKIYTEATPPGGRWMVYQFPSRPDNASDFQLEHSIYNRADVRRELIDWIAQGALAGRETEAFNVASRHTV